MSAAVDVEPGAARCGTVVPVEMELLELVGWSWWGGAGGVKQWAILGSNQ